MSNKALTKPVKQKVAIGLVAASTTKTGVKLVKELRKLQSKVAVALWDHFKSEVPELSVERAVDLLTARTLQPVDLHRVYVYNTGEKTARSFGEYTWRRVGVFTSNMLRTQEQLYHAAYQTWGTGGVLGKGAFHHTSPDLNLERSFAGIPFASMGGNYLHEVPEDTNKDPKYYAINKKLAGLQNQIMDILKQLAELLQSTLGMLEEVEAALAPIKGTKQLVELFPEALKHLPEGFYDPAPAQEVADPTIINEIRAKLAKGLPV